MITRRRFLQTLGVGAAVVVVEPVRKIWQVGAQLEPFLPPGHIRLHDGTLVRLGDFRESDKYDTIVLPPNRIETFEQLDGRGRRRYTRNETSARTLQPGADPHSEMAAQMLGLPLEEARKHPQFYARRSQAKAWSFGARYGFPSNPFFR